MSEGEQGRIKPEFPKPKSTSLKIGKFGFLGVFGHRLRNCIWKFEDPCGKEVCILGFLYTTVQIVG